MRVKRLEIQGFKSFKDKTVIHFDRSITGIVGPNGCGKSNIVDAFFWVMGEQSYKHMRGSGSDDLIFNGSTKYSPLGIAEATMVLDTGYDETQPKKDIPAHLQTKEISITRRLYRSGEGEYLINGQTSRLKDIKELFMDTGVGAKGYSVIEQGQIGKIVNAKPEERRLLIEEAAGIAKYKARKTESLRKMEAAQGNLARLGDIIAEIERQLGSLERQAQKARLYHKYREELVDKEMTWGRRKFNLLTQKIQTFTQLRETLEQELAGIAAQISTSDNQVQIDRLLQAQQGQDLQTRQDELAKLQNDLTKMQSSLELSRHRQNDLSKQLESLSEELTQLATQISYQEAEIQSLESGAVGAHLEFQNACKAAQDLEVQVGSHRTLLEQARKELEGFRKSLLEAIQSSHGLATQVIERETRANLDQAHAEKLHAQSASQTEKIEAYSAQLSKLENDLAQAGNAKDLAHSVVTESTANLIAKETSLKALEQTLSQAEKRLAGSQGKLQNLEALALAHEGFSDGAKHILDQSDREKISTLVDSLTVEPGFEAALEGWLEAQIEELITTDTAYAFSKLEAVSQAGLGRAHIRINHSPEGFSASVPDQSFSQAKDLLSQAGFNVLGSLTEFVQSSSAIGSHLLDRVMVVEAMQPSIPDGLRWSIIAKSGFAYDSHGVLRAGKTASSDEATRAASLLGRKRLIEELKAEILLIETEIDGLFKNRQDLSTEIESLRAELKSAQEDSKQKELQFMGLERDLVQARTLHKEAVALKLSTDQSISEIEQSIRENLEACAKIVSTQEELASKKSLLEATIADCESKLEILQGELQATETAHREARILETTLGERASSQQREIESGKKQLSDRILRKATLDLAIQKASSEASSFVGSDHQLEIEISRVSQAVMDLSQTVSEIKNALEETGSRLTQSMSEVQTLHKLQTEKAAARTDSHIEEEKLRAEIGFHVQNLEEKYGPGCLERETFKGQPGTQDENTEVVTQEMSAEEEQLLNEEVERLRERIRRLGEVNPAAAEEFDQTQTRYNHLMTEKTDLETSIKNLEEAIELINKTSEERFRKAFTAIADRFERLFPVIFGGGAALLKLIYPEGSTDILEAGVDIEAQPPGKRVSNITLLSGGEKALTAVSLIFAIFMVKPSPFCVLDEVDAPLDDTNIGKFNALLKEMSAKSQFILITHNKKTMELNDTLYGVTMEEPGVSKMVSIELH